MNPKFITILVICIGLFYGEVGCLQCYECYSRQDTYCYDKLSTNMVKICPPSHNYCTTKVEYQEHQGFQVRRICSEYDLNSCRSGRIGAESTRVCYSSCGGDLCNRDDEKTRQNGAFVHSKTGDSRPRKYPPGEAIASAADNQCFRAYILCCVLSFVMFLM